MLFSVLGLLGSLMLYLGAMWAMSWSAVRARRVEAQGVSVVDKPTLPSVSEAVHRHGLEWLIGYFVFFFVLGIAGFPLWQRLGTGLLLALFFGSVWFARSGRASGHNGIRSAAINAWYWSLAVADLLGFMWTLCFLGEVALELV